jgi:2'-hydroxyisoflavone reductase
MGQLVQDCLAVTAADMQTVWADPAFLAEQEVGFPIWTDPNGEMGNLLTVDGRRAAAAGLKTRPTRETARDTIAWWKTLPAERTASLRAGLSPEREAELLATWNRRGA